MVKYKRTLAVEADGDIHEDEQGKYVWYDGIRGVKQELKVTLDTVRGEQPFAEDFGLDVFEVAGAPSTVLRREIILTLEEDDRVKQVQSVEIDGNPSERTADVTVNVQLVEGETITLNQEV